MNDDSEDLKRAYQSGLETHFAERGEESLSRAYEIGRRALGAGLGVLDMVAMHQQALRGRPPSPEADDFFREMLSPFEMTFRGYREANDELRQLNAALAQQARSLEAVNRELESFSYSVSHDLRAPLRIIDGYGQAMLEDCEAQLDDEGKRYLKYIRESTQQMGHLIDDLLALARVTRSDLHRTHVDLAVIARRLVERLRVAYPQRQVEVVIAGEMPAIGDVRLLSVVLDNLLGNAWKFTARRPDARIEVGTLARSGETVYFVRDNGAGFDARHAGKLFGAFQRLHTQQEFEGTGIGLATVQRVVTRHGGKVWAEGEVDRGASFFFTLGTEEAER